jgi:hypothetical protein
MTRLAILAALLIATPAMASDFNMKEGRLFHKDDMSTRLISLTNNTTSTASVAVECGFFRDGSLMGTGVAMFYELKPGETGHEPATSVDVGDADKTECRVDVVDRQQN